MDIDPLRLVAFVHVLLLVYWLGADLGVFLCAARLTRDDLSLDERLRVREIAAAIDMGPRTALPLMIPVGFTLATSYGSPITGDALSALWIGTLVWVGLVWTVHVQHGSPLGQTLLKVDYLIRYTALFAMLGLGAYCLAYDAPISDRWLAAKIFLFGIIIANGLWLRHIGGRWAIAFQKVRAGGAERIEGERLIKQNRGRAVIAAPLIWLLVAGAAFLGVVKPF